MELSGKIIYVLPKQEGVGKNGNEWALQPYVLETYDNYPRKVYFEVFGEDKINQNKCEIGEDVTISFDVESHEYNGRWYTTVRAWKVQKQNDDAKGGTAPTYDPLFD